jgi:hypothetical protein
MNWKAGMIACGKGIELLLQVHGSIFFLGRGQFFIACEKQSVKGKIFVPLFFCTVIAKVQ